MFNLVLFLLDCFVSDMVNRAYDKIFLLLCRENRGWDASVFLYLQKNDRGDLECIDSY